MKWVWISLMVLVSPAGILAESSRERHIQSQSPTTTSEHRSPNRRPGISPAETEREILTIQMGQPPLIEGKQFYRPSVRTTRMTQQGEDTQILAEVFHSSDPKCARQRLHVYVASEGNQKKVHVLSQTLESNRRCLSTLVSKHYEIRIPKTSPERITIANPSR